MKQAFLKDGDDFLKSNGLKDGKIIAKSIPTMHQGTSVSNSEAAKKKEKPKKKIPKEVTNFIKEVEDSCKKFDVWIKDIETAKGATVRVTKMMNDFANFKESFQSCTNDLINYPHTNDMEKVSDSDKTRVNISKY